MRPANRPVERESHPMSPYLCLFSLAVPLLLWAFEKQVFEWFEIH